VTEAVSESTAERITALQSKRLDLMSEKKKNKSNKWTEFISSGAVRLRLCWLHHIVSAGAADTLQLLCCCASNTEGTTEKWKYFGGGRSRGRGAPACSEAGNAFPFQPLVDNLLTPERATPPLLHPECV